MALHQETLGKNSESKNILDKLTNGDFKIMEKLEDFWENLKTSELGGMVGGVLAMMKEWFEDGEEKEKPEKKPDPLAEAHAAQREVRAQVDTQRNLSVLKTNLEKKDKPSEKLDQPDGRGIVMVGDSIMRGFQLKYPPKTAPKSMAKDSRKSGDTLAQVKLDRAEFRGMREVRICVGGNNLGDPPDDIIGHYIEIANIAHEEGVPTITIYTRFPISSRMKSELGPEKFRRRQERTLLLKDKLKEAYYGGKFPQGTRLVDLFEQFRIGGKGPNKDELKPHYEGDDPRHPYAAYIEAINNTDRLDSNLDKVA